MSRNNQYPIAAHREELLWALETNQTLVVVGETGSGKSTQIARYLLEAGWAAASTAQITETRHTRFDSR